VGFNNYRYFYLFLLHLEIGTVYWFFMSYDLAMRSGPFTEAANYIFFTFVLASAAFFAVGGLLALHTYLITTNQSTIEMHDNKAAAKLAKEQGELWVNPYDLGWRKNFESVLGANRFPALPHVIVVFPGCVVWPSDGTKFPTNQQQPPNNKARKALANSDNLSDNEQGSLLV
jgi:hypothetical protein